MYYPTLRTNDAEMRALRNLLEADSKNVTPIIELTKSRISKNLPIGSIKKRLDEFSAGFSGDRYILDLCTEDALMNQEILDLFDESNGYIKWIDFLRENCDNRVIPSILYIENGSKIEFLNQAKALYRKYGSVCLRMSVLEAEFSQLYSWLQEVVDVSNILIVANLYYINSKMIDKYKKYCDDFVRLVIGNTRPKCLLFAGSSFPKFVMSEDTAEDEKGYLVNNEIEIERYLKNKFDNISIESADWASIHPIKYNGGGGTWVPRIDLVSTERIDYTRVRRAEGGYAEAARKIQSPQLARMPDSWGKTQIVAAQKGFINGKSPSFWISVRANCWMTIRSRE